MFNHLQYLDRFLSDHKAGIFTNNSPAKVDRCLITPCYRIIGIHKLLPAENEGKHNLFLDIVDSQGRRLPDLVEWGWEGKKPGQEARPLVLDKPKTEPGGNLVIWSGQVIWARVLGKATDVIRGVTTGLPDEGPGSTWGHHSYYTVFMYDEGGVVVPPADPPADCAELERDYDELRATLRAVKELLEQI